MTRTTLLLISLLFLVLATTTYAQQVEKKNPLLPSVIVRTPEGKEFNTSEISNNGNPIILSFFALWCAPCMRELSAIAEIYDDWVDETGVKLIAVSIDDSRSMSRVMPTVYGKNWNFEILLDPNGDFRRAMNVNLIPHNFILDGQGRIVWQHTSFVEGTQHKLIEIVRKLKAGEDISGM
ncbi:MAG TPA: TlpA disulfide reductase family protein [Bacteroidales bacterium]|nr:TlpA disulfide reductase family protein [Bacteroidales bacterium]